MKHTLLNSLILPVILFTTTHANAIFQQCETVPEPDPLIIDLGQDGFHLGSAGIGVEFDLFATGQSISLQWVKAGQNDAFLIADLNGNGIVDNGSELFGNGTRLLGGGNEYAPNGFVALAQYDSPLFGGNNDGQINSDDAVWSLLALWLDSNADGISTPNEMITMNESGLTTLDIIPKQNNRHDSAGNWMPLWSWSHGGNDNHKARYKMVDVFFKKIH